MTLPPVKTPIYMTTQ